MPIADCGFVDTDELTSRDLLAAFGPTIWVDIGFDVDHDYENPGGVVPKSQAMKIPALVDTGASESCIDDALAVKAGLPVIDRQTVSGVGGETEVNIYLGHIHIPPLGFTQWGRFAGVLLSKGNHRQQALIGRSLLRGALLVYDGLNGKVSLAI